MGKLILVPTPLGNLGDITIRAMEVLRGAEIVLAEDTRTSGKLLKLLDIQAPLRAFHMHNEHSLLERTVADIQQRVGMTALVSDAGTPGISDPGFLLVRVHRRRNRRRGAPRPYCTHPSPRCQWDPM